MELAKQIAKYEDRGFSRERAEINVLMENAAFTIFRDFPDAFLLFGGATLVLYHDSMRHSADLDLLSRGDPLPSRERIIASLRRDLTPIAEAIQLGSLRFNTENPDSIEGKIFVATRSGRRLFRIDLIRFGAAVESEIEQHPVEGGSGIPAVIRSASKDLLLLQKAEAFLLRRAVKARDAYDIHLLQQIRATLGAHLRAHLQDTVLANEFESDAIRRRIEQIDVKLCRLELKPILPTSVYAALEEEGFAPLRDGLRALYEEWL